MRFIRQFIKAIKKSLNERALNEPVKTCWECGFDNYNNETDRCKVCNNPIKG